jgi:cyanophycin synthetase
MAGRAEPTLVELRVLDGANLYFPRPAIKLTLEVPGLLSLPEERAAAAAAAAGLTAGAPGPPGSEQRRRFAIRLLAQLARRTAAAAGVRALAVRSRPGPEPTQVVVAYPWRRQHAAEALGRAVAELVASAGSPGLAGRVKDAGSALRAVEPGPGPSLPVPRVPTVAVTGTNGKTTVTRLIAHMGRCAGLHVGWSNTDGIYLDGELVEEGDWSGPGGAARVLAQPGVQLAVLETARGGILRRGVGVAHNDVAVVTNISADHLGDGGVDDMDELIHVKALVAEEVTTGGTVVLNADDPATAALAERPAVRARNPVIRFCTQRPGNPVAARHRAAGGLVYEVVDGELVETEGTARRPMLSVAELPGAFGGRAAHLVANALAAVAACRAAGVSAKDIRRGLATFTPVEANPGRGNVYRAAGRPVIVDYGHNAAALAATGAMITEVWGGRPAAAVTLPGDRRDDLIAQTAEAIAAWCPAVVIYEDADKRGRAPGEMQELISAALRLARPGITITHATGPAQALRDAAGLSGGGPVLFLYEELAAAHDALAAIGAEPWPDGAGGAEHGAAGEAGAAGR